ncbi:hypothetical protein [Flaviaesturariibacter aridisoli]|uniref:DUF4296 domain-containing protein n=1 Tax=Flaviaesturariibacter aridisoli TaxID=2545761 RepID=A0A4R4E391_9BACT|nr:hypothetical protein [Flaviaesturariibacter aridisoli]TCZ73110.1 hypothetical protein E0486_07090 [Flaviaesturariibacter aridisoli]
MKRILYIMMMTLGLAFSATAQDGGPGGRMRQRMQEYLQTRLHLSDSEAERFTPVFINYFNELRQVNQQYRGDRLILQQKIVDLRLRYRDQFRPIMGEKRSNDIFVYEHDFVDQVKRIREERLQNRPNYDRPGKRF